MVGIVGESGCGKSVLARSILRLIHDPPGRIVDGEIRFAGNRLLDFSEKEMQQIRGNEISMIFQEPMTSLNPVYTVGAQVAEVFRKHQKISKREAIERSIEMLDMVGIPSPASRVKEYPFQMSGGMRQRIVIAMALACRPKLILADEPTTALDVTIQAQILSLINELEREFGTSMVLITHDLGVIAEVVARVIVMYAGKLVEHALVDDLFDFGTGPFEFVEWKPKEYFKVKKNKNYRVKGLPYLDEIIVKIIPDETVRLAALQSGDLDYTDNLGSYQVQKMAENPPKGVVLNLETFSSTLFLHFNAGKPPFNDVRVRQAVAYGIDKKEIVESVYGEGAMVQNQPLVPASAWKVDVTDVERDVAKAKLLLKEAGHPQGLNVTLSTATDYWQYMVAVQVVQEQLKEVGINIIIDASDWPTYVGKCLKGAFVMGLAGWPMDYDPVFTYAPCFTPKGAYSFLTAKAYDNPELTELLQQADAAVIAADRKKIFADAVKIIVNDAPWVYLGVGPAPTAQGSYVKDLQPHISGLYIAPKSGFQYVWLDK
jgi:peptide/nickel transport system ATP-binding protein/oligopeptide transport system ATP-binding protein